MLVLRVLAAERDGPSDEGVVVHDTGGSGGLVHLVGPEDPAGRLRAHAAGPLGPARRAGPGSLSGRGFLFLLPERLVPQQRESDVPAAAGAYFGGCVGGRLDLHEVLDDDALGLRGGVRPLAGARRAPAGLLAVQFAGAVLYFLQTVRLECSHDLLFHRPVASLHTSRQLELIKAQYHSS